MKVPNKHFKVTTKTRTKHWKEGFTEETLVNTGPQFNLRNFARMLALEDTVSILIEKVPDPKKDKRKLSAIGAELSHRTDNLVIARTD